VPGVAYATTRQRIEADRARLAEIPRAQARDQARERLTTAFRDDLVPYWLGTEWAFYGTTTTPNEGQIACGYFVSTLLQHAGLRVERVRMAQQASEYIVKTFASESELKRFRRGDRAAVVDWVKARDDGLYVVGLDYHVGVLVKRGESVEFCHSPVTGRQQVTCGDPLTDDGFISRYHVVGPVLTDPVIDAWLGGEPIETYSKSR